MTYLRQFAPAVRFADGPGTGQLLQAVAMLTELYVTDGRGVDPGPVTRFLRGYGQDKHETHSGPASPCVEALARPRRRVWPSEGLPVL
jgi:hypothetical protein